MHAVGSSQPVSLLDVSRTGARMSFNVSLYLGQEVWLRLQPADIFGTVVWIADGECGIRFDQPFSDADVARLRAMGKVEIRPRLTPRERRAIDRWQSSLEIDPPL
jgi:hypothetical protein